MNVYVAVTLGLVALFGTGTVFVVGDNSDVSHTVEDELDYDAIIQREMELKDDDYTKWEDVDDMSRLPAAALSLQRTGQSIYTSSIYGGGGGAAFSDRAFEIHGQITIIRVWSGRLVDAIQVTYGVQTTPKHGGGGGSRHNFYLGREERITKVTIRAGRVVDRIGFKTSLGRTLGEVGGTGGQYHVLRPPYDTCYVSSIEGRSGRYIDQLCFRWQC
ncbi:uncharacterized protein LOC144874356 [Branchiostoma floridae x Branchiostoma japonicum]